MIILITPTGGRGYQFKLCAQYMLRQTYTGRVTWIITDDVLPISSGAVREDFRDGWDVVKLYPRPYWQLGQNTQGRNLAEAVRYITTKMDLKAIRGIFIIEDDDYYKPCYLEVMQEKLKGHSLIGQTCTYYYNVTHKRWHKNLNYAWSSLFQTAFTPAILPLFNTLYGEKFIDYRLFELAQKKLLFDGEPLSIGIKGMAGRDGIGAGHNKNTLPNSDPLSRKLFELVGNDVVNYVPNFIELEAKWQDDHSLSTG